MRSMALGLIRGSIDEVDQVVHVTYVKVRVMCLLCDIVCALCVAVSSCAGRRRRRRRGRGRYGRCDRGRGSTVSTLCAQPRVLSKEQLAALRDRTLKWSEKVKGAWLYVEDHSREIFA
jgi:hypothetical protein